MTSSPPGFHCLYKSLNFYFKGKFLNPQWPVKDLFYLYHHPSGHHHISPWISNSRWIILHKLYFPLQSVLPLEPEWYFQTQFGSYHHYHKLYLLAFSTPGLLSYLNGHKIWCLISTSPTPPAHVKPSFHCSWCFIHILSFSPAIMSSPSPLQPTRQVS